MEESDLKRLVESNAAETRRHFDVTAERLEARIDTSTAEIRRHFDVTSERLEQKIQLVVEAVAELDEKGDRETASVRDEMRRGFADTQAMIKF
jgi:DNA-binding ferritin-like protein